MTKGEERMMQIKEKEKQEKREYKKQKKQSDKYFDFAIEKICPKCGKDLIEIEQCKAWINGEYGGIALYIQCDCGFRYEWLPHDITLDEAKKCFAQKDKEEEKPIKITLWEKIQNWWYNR